MEKQRSFWSAFGPGLLFAGAAVGVSHLVVAVPNAYKYKSGGRTVVNRDYDSAVAVAKALYGHSRISMPYGLTILGY